ncbi:MAG: hypothetical protein HGA51_00500 [Demequinaceae bacterium]|nr:hypothetical protein [Demequinaceae bacterium]
MLEAPGLEVACANDYQEPVIMGFSTEDSKFRTYLALVDSIIRTGNAIVLEEPDRLEFVELLAATGERAQETRSFRYNSWVC